MLIACNEELLGISRVRQPALDVDMVRLVSRYATQRLITASLREGLCQVFISHIKSALRKLRLNP